jgi:hypothetical protein
MTLASGKMSSEYEKASRAEKAGYGLAALAFPGAVVLALLGLLWAAAAAATAGVSGILLVGMTVRGYSHSRAVVKSAHENSKIRVVQHRGI